MKRPDNDKSNVKTLAAGRWRRILRNPYLGWVGLLMIGAALFGSPCSRFVRGVCETREARATCESALGLEVTALLAAWGPPAAKEVEHPEQWPSPGPSQDGSRPVRSWWWDYSFPKFQCSLHLEESSRGVMVVTYAHTATPSP